MARLVEIVRLRVETVSPPHPNGNFRSAGTWRLVDAEFTAGTIETALMLHCSIIGGPCVYSYMEVEWIRPSLASPSLFDTLFQPLARPCPKRLAEVAEPRRALAGQDHRPLRGLLHLILRRMASALQREPSWMRRLSTSASPRTVNLFLHPPWRLLQRIKNRVLRQTAALKTQTTSPVSLASLGGLREARSRGRNHPLHQNPVPQQRRMVMERPQAF